MRLDSKQGIRKKSIYHFVFVEKAQHPAKIQTHDLWILRCVLYHCATTAAHEYFFFKSYLLALPVTLEHVYQCQVAAKLHKQLPFRLEK